MLVVADVQRFTIFNRDVRASRASSGVVAASFRPARPIDVRRLSCWCIRRCLRRCAGDTSVDTLAKAGIESAHSEGLQVVAKCHFVKAYLRKHPQPSPL
jgi:hypothetical protein